MLSFLRCVVSHGGKLQDSHPSVQLQYLIAFTPVVSSFPIKDRI